MYLWKSKKLNRKVHIQNEHGLSLCLVEKGGTRLDAYSDRFPKGRKLCGICGHLNGQPSKKAIKKKRGQKAPFKHADRFLQSREWKEIRYRALKLAGGKCQCCGAGSDDGVVLQVDHIKPRHRHPELALTLANLQVLCASCNMGKGGWDDTDWREPRLATLMGEAIE